MLVLNWNTQRLTESGFMEKPGIKPETPGLQGKGLSPTPGRLHFFHFSYFFKFRTLLISNMSSFTSSYIFFKDISCYNPTCSCASFAFSPLAPESQTSIYMVTAPTAYHRSSKCMKTSNKHDFIKLCSLLLV